VLVNLTRTGPMLKRVFGQPWAEDLDAFRSQYAGLLALVGEAAGRVIAASPLLIGENLNNEWNQKLARYIAVTREEADRAGAEFVDLRARAAGLLAGKPISSYLPTSHWRTLLDGLTLLTDDQIARMSSRRGLHLTLDGVHLNPTGAEMVAEAFAAALHEAVGADSPNG
jgi:lysophospholipase L1-like esterase